MAKRIKKDEFILTTRRGFLGSIVGLFNLLVLPYPFTHSTSRHLDIKPLLKGVQLASPTPTKIRRYNSTPPDTIGKRFDGEELKYRIGFWWFNNAAKGRIDFIRNGEDRYLAGVEAETLGFIGWITRYRKDIYRIYMDEIDGGRRLRTYLFEKTVTIGKRVRKGYIRFDYDKRTMEWKSWGGNRPERGKTEAIPSGIIYDDPVAALYNFRFGAYGEVMEGKSFFITTFPKDGKPSQISIRVASDEEKKRRLSNYNGIEYLVDLKINGELIDSRTGDIEIHMDRELVPVEGIVKDVFFFGDVRGRLLRG